MRDTTRQHVHQRGARRKPAVAQDAPTLPAVFEQWFASRGWTPRDHQPALLKAASERRPALLIAPTGAGKTLAGFLPSLMSLAQRGCAKKGAGHLFAGLDTVILDELHALAASKRGDLLALDPAQAAHPIA